MTPNLGFLEQLAAQSQHHLTFNALARTLDCLLHLTVVDRAVNTPPGSPAPGQRWIVGGAPTGQWAGHANDVAAWDGGKWVFFVPKEGWLAWVADEDAIYAWNGSAWAAFSGGGGGRERLIANRTYFIRTDGNDGNTGLVDSAGGAFLTIQKFIDTVAGNLDLAGFNAIGQVRDGTYAGMVLANAPFVGKGDVIIQGNAGTPANVVVSASSVEAVIQAQRGATLFVRDLQVQSSGGSTAALDARNGGQVRFQNLRFGACAGQHVGAFDNGYVEINGDYAIVGGGSHHFFAARNSTIRNVNPRTVTLTGAPAFSGEFARSDRSGVLQAASLTFSGSATGKRYRAETNAVIVTGGGGANYFPGNAAGDTDGSGVYV